MKKSFKSPNEAKIPGRSSTITGIFVNSIVPNIKPTDDELNEVYRILELNDNNLLCAYCSDKATEWDHFRPTVNKKKPTGYLADIYNLVPACGKCNQSKGGKYWKTWIQSEALLSPRKRIENKTLEKNIKRLEQYEEWSKDKVNKVDYDSLDSETKKLLEQHWKNCEEIINKMYESQRLAETIKEKIKNQKGWS